MTFVMENGHIELTRELREPASPAFSQPEPQRCCGRRILLFFVILHICTLLSEIVAILNFFIFANYSMMCAMAVPLILSGMVCCHVAWNAELTHLKCSYLPLKSQKWYWKALLWMPLGLFQGVIVLLAWDDHLEHSSSDESEILEAPPQRDRSSDSRSEPGSDWNRFHCKAGCIVGNIIEQAKAGKKTQHFCLLVLSHALSGHGPMEMQSVYHQSLSYYQSLLILAYYIIYS